MKRKDKVQYIQDRLGDAATVEDAERVLEALEYAEVVALGKIYDRGEWEEAVKHADFLSVLEDEKAGRNGLLRMSDRYGLIRVFEGAQAALEALAERLERSGYRVELVETEGAA